MGFAEHQEAVMMKDKILVKFVIQFSFNSRKFD